MTRGPEELGIVTPTEVEKEVIPFLITDGSDLIAQAQTGTGKMAAFGLPLPMKVDTIHRDISPRQILTALNKGGFNGKVK